MTWHRSSELCEATAAKSGEARSPDLFEEQLILSNGVPRHKTAQ
jgi:hypothetical protein